ncbi:hypothetical protein LPJ62_002563 [Coemansia sp. RSA 2167]|nr:hypothetical protein LPJ69_003505 [Coemansia sp. RSA 1752]KAJ1777389.1 hypothetical protein LPJ54_002441 [Coemansia sp. RSA 1824]KAJ1786716.1 hypothetical protein LPJ67_003462 [Coemansia sp. RSA 1938]KAJ1789131.1 hypothetical protein LPJ62_002563 [Coemansia sp. RSA 2167]
MLMQGMRRAGLLGGAAHWRRAGLLEGATYWRKHTAADSVRLYSSWRDKVNKGNPWLSNKKKKGKDSVVADLPKSELVYGLASAKAAICQGRRTIHGAYVQSETAGDLSRDRLKEIVALAAEHDIPVVERSKDILDTSINGASHQGVILKVSAYDAQRVTNISRVEADSYQVTTATEQTIRQPRRRFPLWVYCCALQDTHNFGSIIRSALFFGADAIVVPAYGAVKPTSTVSKVSSGAMECIDVYRVSDHEKLLDRVLNNGWSIVCATTSRAGSGQQHSVDSLPRLNAPTILVIGNEGSGIPDDVASLSSMNVHIPARAELPSYIDSLNAGVAAGIILSAIKFEGE